MTQLVLELASITKYFGAKLVLDRVSLLINRTDRIGLVGENGAGKTTLAAIIMGEAELDSGSVKRPAGLQIGYLPQEAHIDDAISVQQFLQVTFKELDEARVRLETLEAEMSRPLPPAEMDRVLEAYGAAQEEFSRRGGYDFDHQVDTVFAGLDLAHLDRSRPMHTLSGGEKTRVMLAGLLLRAPDLLILDEPTNHLDFVAVEWLEEYLSQYSGALLAISHDRRFLNRAITQIAELSPSTHTITTYHGNYDYYLAERARIAGQQLAAYEEQTEELKDLQQLIKAKSFAAGKGRAPTDNDKFAKAFFKGRVEEASKRQIRNAKRRVEQIEENRLDHPTRRWSINPEFSPNELISRDVIQLIDLSKGFPSAEGERSLISHFTATITAGERVVLVGANGTGKSTLLKMIMGLESDYSGVIKIAGGARLGYLDQEQETLDPALTVLETFSQDLTGTEDERRASLHKYGLFSGTQVEQTIATLSVGQRRKLQIARLIALKANVLILDEPTNHLDLDSIEQFEDALLDFGGTILATSHDRTFIDKVATTLWQINATGIHIEQVEPL